MTTPYLPQPIPQQSPSPDIIQFGCWMKQQLYSEIGTSAGTAQILTPREQTFITERLLQGKTEIETAYLERLGLRREFYLGVKQHLQAILQAWDAVLDERNAVDEKGHVIWNRQFMESFLICTDIIPCRVNIGSFGSLGAQNTSEGFSSPQPAEQLSIEAGNEHGRGIAGHVAEHMEASDVLPIHEPEYLALSDDEVDDTTTEDENEDEYGVEYCYYEGGDDEEDDSSGEDGGGDGEEINKEEFEYVVRPPTPYPGLNPDEPELWHHELQRLLNEASDESEEELSDLDEFATPKEHRSATPTPVDMHVWTDESSVQHLPGTSSPPSVKQEQRYVSKKRLASKKRSRDMLSEPGNHALDEDRPRSKRLRK